MVDSAGGKENCMGVFVEVFRESQSFRGVDQRSGGKADKVKYRCRLTI